MTVNKNQFPYIAMRRKLRPFRNYVLRFRFALHRIRVIERIAAPDCSAPADQEAHLSSNILFGVAISITCETPGFSLRFRGQNVRRKPRNLLGNNLIYPLRRIYTKDLLLFISTFLRNLRGVEINTLEQERARNGIVY